MLSFWFVSFLDFAASRCRNHLTKDGIVSQVVRAKIKESGSGEEAGEAAGVEAVVRRRSNQSGDDSERERACGEAMRGQSFSREPDVNSVVGGAKCRS